ncbi:MAG: hypothetical protein ABEK16_00225 [Candidatus Nanohalobium sp.]
MKPEKEMYAVIGFSILVGIVCAVLTSRTIFSPVKFAETAVLAKVFLTSMNTVLLGGLTFNYLKIYRNMPTPTSRVFLIFSSALMMYALTANPLIQILFGFKLIPLGPFTYLPELFLTAATGSVLYESYR